MRLADAVEGHDNNFNLIRMIAACGVLVSHAYPIALGPSAIQPLEALLGFTLGDVSVLIFFAVSGLLITQSFLRSRSFARWCMARVLRIFPALIVVTTLTALILGPGVTTLASSAYFSDLNTYTYILRNSTMAFLQYPLPGVFESNPWARDVNGSLWTLFYEMVCYAGVAVFGLIGAFSKGAVSRAALAVLVAAFVALWIAEARDVLHTRLANLFHLGLPFAVGAVFFHFRQRIVLRLWIAIVMSLIVAATLGTAIFPQLFVIALTYWTFYLAYVPSGAVRSYNELGDYSYGMYVYAFPVQQTVTYMLGDVTPVTNMLIAFPITLACAAASWYVIEKPALSLKQRRRTALEPVNS